ncbi:hypothetical protein KA977_12725 [Candidatus Dependentiae bacterium]|nr:hypothetical protein [Candidatus Dependentiae bacterium]
MLLRYHSRFSNYIKEILENYNITDYVFSSDVSFFDPQEKEHNLFKNKAWPESHEIIVKAISDEVSDAIFDKITQHKEQNNIGNKIKIILVPIIKNG